MVESTWRRFKHLPLGKYHAFTSVDETVSVCGNSVKRGEGKTVEELFLTGEDTAIDKCRKCLWLLDGSFIIARAYALHEGMSRRH